MQAALRQRASISGVRQVRAQLRRVHVSAVTCNLHREAGPEECQKLLGDGKHKYIDVRTAEEFSAGHCPGAVNVPVFLPGMQMNPQFPAQVQQAFPDKAVPLVVGCKSGRRSLMAIDMMNRLGYKDLVNVAGGFDLWAGLGLPVTK